jgi:hypothetical protein
MLRNPSVCGASRSPRIERGIGFPGRSLVSARCVRFRVFAHPRPSPISRVSLAGPSPLRGVRYSTGFGTPDFLVFFFLWSILVGFLCDFFQGGFLLFSFSFSIFCLLFIFSLSFLFVLFYFKISNISIFISFKFEQIWVWINSNLNKIEFEQI